MFKLFLCFVVSLVVSTSYGFSVTKSTPVSQRSVTRLHVRSRRDVLAGLASTTTFGVASAVIGVPSAFAGVPSGKAPSFDLPNSKGEGSTSLEKLLKTGKWTVLYFYPGAFTSGCTLEARNFNR